MTQNGTNGRLLAGRYRLGRVLGRGGMGTVWQAHDEMLGRDVAVKEVRPPDGLTAEQRDLLRRRVLREARAAARISSPSAVTVYDVVEEDGEPWLVLQLLPPRTLADVITSEGRLPPARVAAIGLDLVDALQAAHRSGVLHRDVKPANVMLADGRAVLTDFGIAVVDDDPTLTSTGMLVGSPAFMAPERARGERPSPASDLWSLGATLYAATEGDSPFRREGQLPTLSAVLTEAVPPPVHAGPLRALLTTLLDREPERRPDADHTRRMLADALAEARREATLAETVPAAAAPVAAAPAAAVVPVPVPSPPVGDAGGSPTLFTPTRAVPVTDAPASTGPTDPTGTTGTSRGRVLAVALVVLLVAAVAAATALLRRPDAGAGPASGAAPSASAPPSTAVGGPATPTGGVSPSDDDDEDRDDTGTSGRSGSSGSSGPSGSPGSSGSSGSSGASSGQGGRRYTDPTGFSLVLPQGWTVSRRGSDVTAREPRGRAYLLVAQTTRPKPDALRDWQAQAASAGDRFPGYRELRLERVPYQGWDAADWEFTWTPSGGPLRVLNRNVRVSDRRAYALYWSVPAGRWDALRPAFDTAAASFRPAP